MKLLTITNLYPRPDQPQRGLFNAQLFAALARALAGKWGAVQNTCLVPEWKPWRWYRIPRWEDPFGGSTSVHTSYLPVLYLPLIGRNMSWKTYGKALEKMESAASEADSILATWLYPDGVAAAGMAAKMGKPIWIRIHGSDMTHLRSKRRRERILEACAQASGILCVSKRIADQMKEAGVDAGKVHVAMNGVDLDKFRYRSKRVAKKELPSIAQQVVSAGKAVLFAGNLVRVKGLDRLLKAWAAMASEDANEHVTLLVAGDGPMKARLQQMCQKLGIAGRVVFLGEVPHDQMPLWMNLADCLCIPSRSEGTPNVALEALASGLPVVSTDVGACRQLLAGETTCCVIDVEPGRRDKALIAALVESLADVLDTEMQREDMAERHRDGLSWDKSARKFLDLMGQKS